MKATLRALIVDDEPLACRGIELALEQDPAVEVVGVCHDGASAVARARELSPQLLLLDVRMPRMSGFDVLRELGQEAPPAVILLTAHEVYAVRAFESGVVDYLVKPFRDSRLRRSLERARVHLRGSRSTPYRERIIIRRLGQVQFLGIEEVVWVESVSCYVRLHTMSDSVLLREPIAALERDFDPQRFLRIHRSTLVRIDQVRELERVSKGEYRVHLRSGVVRKVSRRRLGTTRRALGL